MKKISTLLMIFLAAVGLNGCCSQTPNQDAGVITGAIAGGLLGSVIGHGSGQALAIGIGAMSGALIGAQVGRNMDQNDRMRMNQALNNNNVGAPAYWKNDHTGYCYTVVPVKDVAIEGNPYCREYRTTAIIAGKRQEMYGTACRQPDGSWQAQN